jgi:hypothetical protein
MRARSVLQFYPKDFCSPVLAAYLPISLWLLAEVF